MIAKAILIAAACVVFGIGMGVREMFADIWARAAIAALSAGLGAGIAGVGVARVAHGTQPQERNEKN
jgi:hypothetical protein